MIKFNTKDVDKLMNGLKTYENRVMNKQVHPYLIDQTSKMRNDAHAKRKWTDRTHQAERSIAAIYKRQKNGATITLEGFARKKKPSPRWGIDYFQHLEYGFGKRYATLRPTVDRFVPRITKSLGTRIKKVKVMGR